MSPEDPSFSSWEEPFSWTFVDPFSDHVIAVVNCAIFHVVIPNKSSPTISTEIMS